MTSNPIVWLVLGPILLAVVAPMIRAAFARWQPPVHAAGHLLILLLGLATLLTPPEVVAIAVRANDLGVQAALDLSRATAAELVLAATLITAISFFSDRIVRGSRHGGAFLSLLALEQAAVNLILLSDGILGLYIGLVLLSLTLMLMIGLDFSAEGRDAAFRVFATLELPAALALAGFWLASPSAGALALADGPARFRGLPAATALSLTLPIAVALICRAALAPLHHWVIDGCRRAAAPVAVAIAGVAVPLGGLVLARAVALVSPDHSDWLPALALLGVLTALVGGIGALSESNALGWLGYVAVAQVGFATVGFASGNDAGNLVGWLGLSGGALGITIAGLGLTGAIQETQGASIERLARGPVGPASAILLAFGALSLAPLPPFVGFQARATLLASQFGTDTGSGLLTTVLVALATFLAAAGVLRLPLALVTGALASPAEGDHPASVPPTAQRARPDGPQSSLPVMAPAVSEAMVRAPIAAPIGLAALTILLRIIPLTWLAPIVGITLPPAGAIGANLLGQAVAALAIGGALGWGRLWGSIAGRVRVPKRAASRLAGIQRRYRLERAGDPYLIIGGSLLALGKASAAILNHTLGRLARAG